MRKGLAGIPLFVAASMAVFVLGAPILVPPDSTNHHVVHIPGRNKTAVPSTASDGNLHFNVKLYGAKSDGVTDDSTAIQSAANAIPSGGGILLFPSGNYHLGFPIKLTKPIRLQLGAGIYDAKTTAFDVASNGVVIIGSGSSETFIKTAGTSPLITNSKPVQGLMIRGMFLTGPSFRTTGSGLIDLNGLNSATIENISSSGGSYGVHLSAIFDVWASRLVLSRAERADLFVDGGNRGQASIQSHFYAIDLNQGSGDGLLIAANGGLVDANTFMNVTAENDQGIGFHLSKTTGSNTFFHCETADERGPEQWYIESSGNSFFYSHAERTHTPASIDYVVSGNKNAFFYQSFPRCP